MLGSVALIVTGGKLIAYATKSASKNTPKTLVSHIREFVFSDNRTLKGFKEDRINIVLLGIGGAGHEGPQLTDTILLVSIEPSTKKIALLSIPRDLAVEIPDHGVQKINAANAYGEEQEAGRGGELARETIAKIFNIPIHYWVRVNFKAFEEIVDALGGITVTVEREFTDNNFPDGTGHTQTIVFERGTQHFDGARALIFSRSRHGTNGENSDFARARRQQLILTALRQKFTQKNAFNDPQTALEIIRSLLNYVETNINMLTLAYTADELFKLAHASISHHVLTPDPRNGLLEEINNDYGYFLVPKSGDYMEIAQFVANIFKNTETVSSLPNPTSIARTEKATVAVLNGTWSMGLAKKIADTLASNDIKISYVGNTEMRNAESSLLYAANQYERTKRAMAKITPLFNTHISETSPKIPGMPNVDIIIVVGKDNASYATTHATSTLP